ncbi:MAG TPA: glycosyltransferase [Vicinamibacterales bacterium]|nr:glycosyltransferase [Vicinamibacterales bacterium]
MTPITIGITTRNRAAALERCVRSLGSLHIDDLAVLVFDDASDPPVDPGDAWHPGVPVRVIRDERGVGYIAGRNRLVQEAGTDYVLLLDDDTALLSADAIGRACEILDADRAVGAVAFAQAEADGRPWPESMQPGRGEHPAVVSSFTGFAHLIRRELFLRLGGYLERLVFYGEEKDFCVRLMDAGFKTVYLPEARVAHLPDPSGRSQSRYVRYVIRNDCLSSFHREPWPLALVGLPVRLWRYTRMARNIEGGDSGGLTWIVGQLVREFPAAVRARRAVKWSTIRAWRRLSRTTVPYVRP